MNQPHRARRWVRLKRALAGLGLLLVGLGLTWGIVYLVKSAGRPEGVVFTPTVSQAEAEALVARMLATNRPWLDPKPLRASYAFRREATTWSLSQPWKERSLRRLRNHELEVTSACDARWLSQPELRVGVALGTPLHSLWARRSPYTVQVLGRARWRGQSIVAVDILFQNPIGANVGMGVDGHYYSRAGFQTRNVRLFIEPQKALPLFMGLSDGNMFGTTPRFQSTFVLDPDFYRLETGVAPRRIEWHWPSDSWRTRFEFQVADGSWLFRRGRALIAMDRWTRLDHRLEMVNLKTQPLRPGDLLQEYPTSLTAGDAAPEHARVWQFTPTDIFHVSRFHLALGQDLRLELASADLGIGHCPDGAVWAVILPREPGTLAGRAAAAPERPEQVWLRFHPQEIGRLFPPETLAGGGDNKLAARICALANLQMTGPWTVEGRALLPEPGQMLVDVQTKEGPRRCFTVDTRAGTARYEASYETQPLRLSRKAIEAMSRPLPDHRKKLAEAATNSAGPKVVSVEPAPGARDVAAATPLRVRFDRPMHPLALSLSWDCGDYQVLDNPSYDPNRFEFTIPLRLMAGVVHQVVVNNRNEMFSMGSFVDTNANPAAMYVWRFVTRSEPEAPEAPDQAAAHDSPAPAGEATLLDVLQSLQQRRQALTSVVERAQTSFQSHSRGFCTLGFQGSTFKWQSPGLTYGDVSQIMGGTFRLGCDGRQWWWQRGGADSPEVTICPVKDMQVTNCLFADPFRLATTTPAAAIKNLGLVYLGLTNRAGVACHQIEARPKGPTEESTTRWWIDAASGLPMAVESYGRLTRYLYDAVNQPLRPAEFAPWPRPGEKSRAVQPLPPGYTQRFINLRDGSDGSMSARWGELGPGGRSSSGLN